MLYFLFGGDWVCVMAYYIVFKYNAIILQFNIAKSSVLLFYAFHVALSQ